MISVLRSRRNQHLACIGLELSDTQMRFMELAPHEGGGLVPKSFGTIGIAYDVVTNGEIYDRASLIESLKRLRQKTKSSQVRFSTYGDDALDAKWIELFAVAGFAHAQPIDKEGALITYMLGIEPQEQPEVFGYFTSKSVLDVYMRTASGTSHISYSYPLDEVSAREVARLTTVSLRKRIPITGHLPEPSQEVIRNLDRHHIDAYAQDVWRRCFDYDSFVPSLSYENSFKFIRAIAMAYAGAVEHDAIRGLPSLMVQKKPVVIPKQEVTVQERYKNIMPVSTPVSEQTDIAGKPLESQSSPDKPSQKEVAPSRSLTSKLSSLLTKKQ